MKRITTFLLLGLLLIATACEKAMEGETYQVYDEKMIDEIMEENHLSAFLSIVEKGELSGTIHAYGTYTLFAPTNEAVSAYLQKIGKSNVEALSKDEAADIVKYHLVRDTLLTTDFVDGRLASPNFQRKYLTTKTESEGSEVFFRVNRQAKIIQKNLRGSNGYVQIIDEVLIPPVQTVADRMEELPDADYSLMKALFARSGLRDSLSVQRTDHWFTFFIQDNKAFADAGIHSIDDLLSELRANSPAIDNDETLIYNYMAYHGSNKLAYIADLLVASDLTTLAPKQIIMLKRDLDKILLNEFIMPQSKEEGILLDRTSEYSDWTCANGVIHKINGNIQIKNRSAYRVYWDVAEQPEIMALKTFRKAGTTATFASGDLADITWGGKSSPMMTYYCGSGYYSTTLTDTEQYIYGDRLEFLLNTNIMQWIEIKTPVLVQGKYKIWMCYRRENDTQIKSTFKQEGYDDQVLPTILDPSEDMPSPIKEGSSHELIEINGWKQYNAKKYDSRVISHLLGLVVVETTGRHILRLDAISHKHSNYPMHLDMIQFIPLDEDQLWPRVDIKGNWFTSDMPACQAWPVDCVEE